MCDSYRQKDRKTERQNKKKKIKKIRKTERQKTNLNDIHRDKHVYRHKKQTER